jgi:hypothetical protein
MLTNSLRPQGVTAAAPPRPDGRGAVPLRMWGFPSQLPAIEDLMERADHQGRIQPYYQELLNQSRTFHSPDCADAMAEILACSDLFVGLRWRRMAAMHCM